MNQRKMDAEAQDIESVEMSNRERDRLQYTLVIYRSDMV